jgi:uncharacterized membrane protein YccC
MVVVVATGLRDPDLAPHTAAAIIEQILLGVAASFSVAWLGRLETEVKFDATAPPLWPIRFDWLNHSARITAGMLAAFGVTMYFDLPITAAMVSAGIIGVAPGQRARLVKGSERLAGAVLGSLYAFPALWLIYCVPRFGVLLVLVCFGMFLAAYFTRTAVSHGYVFLQMGLVIPMVLIGTGDVVGSAETAIDRLIGVWTAMMVTLAVETLWPGEVNAPPSA